MKINLRPRVDPIAFIVVALFQDSGLVLTSG